MSGNIRLIGAIAAVGWAGSLNFLFVSLQPILVGAWIDRAGLTSPEAGLAASANLLGALVGALATLALISRISVRSLVVASSLIMTCASGTIGAVDPHVPLLWGLLFLDGVGAGIVGAAAAASAGAMPRPARVYAILIAAQILSGAAALAAAPHIVSELGLPTLFYLIAFLSLLIAPLAGFLYEPRANAPHAAGAANPANGSLLLLGSLGLLFVANNAVWAYLERIAVDADLSHADVGLALGVGQAMSLVFAIAAGWLDNLDRRLAIIGGIVLMSLAAPVFVMAPTLVGISIGVTGFLGAICFVVPYYMGAFAASDATGRLLVWGQSVVTIGLILGPPLAALTIERTSLTAMVWASVGVTLLGLAVAIPALLRSHSNAAEQPAC